MSLSVIGLLIIIFVMVVLFLTEKIAIDLTAVIGLSVLILLGYLKPEDAFIGFSSPAIITLVSMYFIGSSLKKTGVADSVAYKISSTVGTSEFRNILAVMFLAAVLSAFMSNVATTAVLLPAVSSIARRNSIAPSKLFIPLAFASILGGMITLIGTTPNILISDALTQSGYEPFKFLDFAYFGLPLTIFGVLFITLVARFLLPNRNVSKKAQERSKNLTKLYKLYERLFFITVPRGSKLDGKSLREGPFGALLGVSVVSISREGEKFLNPDPNMIIQGGDTLMVQGKIGKLKNLLSFCGVSVHEVKSSIFDQSENNLLCADLVISQKSSYVSQTLRDVKFANTHEMTVIGLRREEVMSYNNLGEKPLSAGDVLHVIGTKKIIEAIVSDDNLEVAKKYEFLKGKLNNNLFLMKISSDSHLANRTIVESKIANLFGVRAIAIIREGNLNLVHSGAEKFLERDQVVLVGNPEKIQALSDLGDLEINNDSAEDAFDVRELEISEIVVAPRSQSIGKTLVEANFREKYNLQVMAIWRDGRPIRSGVSNIALRLGDALLLHGSINKVSIISQEEDFVVLSEADNKRDLPPVRNKKSPYALLSLAVMILLSIFQLMPVHIASFLGAVIAVLSGSIKMEDAYKAVSWRIVVLIAALIPLGVVVESSGTASFISQTVLSLVGDKGPFIILISLCVFSSIVSQCLDSAVSVVLLSPIAISISRQLGIEPYAFMMGIALSSSVAFLTPFSHKASLLVMGAGGYRTRDYFRIGLPLSIFCLLGIIFLIPLVYAI